MYGCVYTRRKTPPINHVSQGVIHPPHPVLYSPPSYTQFRIHRKASNPTLALDEIQLGGGGTGRGVAMEGEMNEWRIRTGG